MKDDIDFIAFLLSFCYKWKLRSVSKKDDIFIPDWTFHDFRASKCVLWSSQSSIHKLGGSKLGELVDPVRSWDSAYFVLFAFHIAAQLKYYTVSTTGRILGFNLVYPDKIFHNIRGSKCVDQTFSTTRNSQIQGVWNSKFARCRVRVLYSCCKNVFNYYVARLTF